MESNELKRLLEKFRRGACSPSEQKQLEDWYNDRVRNEGSTIAEDVIHQDLAEIYERLPHLAVDTRPIKVKKKPYISWAAAFVLLAASIFTAIYLHDGPKQVQMHPVAVEDLEPGSNKAILKLANDSIIALNNMAQGHLIWRNGVNVSKDEEGRVVYTYTAQQHTKPEIHTLYTPKGGQYQVVLADGTKVWLNAASSLQFPTAFDGTERLVELVGEGYFEVAPDQSKPFRIRTSTQVITVLGTRFNVSSYADEQTSTTTLITGSVRIQHRSTQESVLLKPGEQAIVHLNQAMDVVKVDPQAAIAWKNGLFRFEGADIKQAMRQYARWYDVEVAFEGAVPDVTLWGEVHRDNQASQTLEILGYFDVQYKIVNRAGVRKIIISK